MYTLLGFVCALVLSLIFMPLIIKIAHSRKLFDEIDDRKIHTGNVPRLGGVGILLSFVAAIVIVNKGTGAGIETGNRFWVVVMCMLAVHVLGLIDDFRNLRAVYKFIIELACSLALVALGFRFKSIVLPFSSCGLDLGMVSFPLSIIWIIGITNALNLIDGMDGLGGGISAFIASAFGVFFLLRNDPGAALVCFALLGAILGFLVFNFPPAKIFMGDCGALSLGFTLAMLPLIGPASNRIEIGIVPSITVLVIPIYDTFAAMIRRLRAGVSIFMPDKGHLHHKLLDLGLDVKRALAVIYGAQALLCLVALSSLVLARELSFFLNILLWVLYAIAFYFLGLAAGRKRVETCPITG